MTAPNTGIHELFERSDQHYYLHKCNRCNHWNEMKYEEYDPSSPEAGGNILTVNPDGVDLLAKTIVDGSFQYVCNKCGKPLDRWLQSEWVAKYPERTRGGKGTRGYYISQLNAVWVSADELKRKEIQSKSKQSFYNYTLGKPYEDKKLTILPSDITNHVYDSAEPIKERGKYKFISVGIDWGNINWIVITGLTEDGRTDLLNLIPIETPSATDASKIGADIEQIKLALRPYDPDIIIADVGDSGDKIAKLMKIYGEDKVYGCVYKSSPRSTGQLIPVWSENKNIVTVDKLMQNKRAIARIKEGEINHWNNPNDKQLQTYIYHWQNVVIRDEEDEDSGELYQTIGRKGDDHYSQSTIYSLIGLERIQEIYYGNQDYTFQSTSVDLNPEPTQADIFSQF